MAANVNKELADQIAEILQRLTSLDTKMDTITKQNEERLGKIEGRLFDIEQKQDGIELAVKDTQRNVDLSAEMMIGIEHEVKLNTAKSIDNEQYQRNFNIRIFNLDESESETIEECEEKVLELFNTKLGVKVKIEDIDVLHRLGPKSKTRQAPKVDDENNNQTPNNNDGEQNMETSTHNTDANTSNPQTQPALASATEANKNKVEEADRYSRPIIVSFVARRVRRMVIANRSKLKKTPGQTKKPIVITEDLTKWHHALLSKARDSQKYDGGVWPMNGKILAKHRGRIIRIKGFADIDQGPPTTKHIRYSQYPYLYRGRGGNRRGPPRGAQRGRGYPRQQLFNQDQGHGGRHSSTGDSQESRASPFMDRGLVATSNRYEPLGEVIDIDNQE